MAQKYKEKAELGKEYVTAAKKLREYTYDKCINLPKEWETFLTGPLIQSADRIEELAIRANKVYIKDKNQTADINDIIASYLRRQELLQEIITEISVFGTKFSRLMGEVDLLGNEVRRIKSIIHRIAEEEETSGQIDIKVKMSTRDIEFETLSGTEKVRIGITAKRHRHHCFL